MRDSGAALKPRRGGGIRRRFGDWFRHRLTEQGQVLCVTGISGVMFGLDGTHAAAALLGFACFALLAAATFWTWRSRPRLEVTRQLPEYVTVGSSARYSLRVTNPLSVPAHGLLLRDCQRAVAAPQASLPWARWQRWRHARRLSRTAPLLRHEPLALPVLPPGQPVTIVARFLPERRGAIEFCGIEILRPDPLGLMYARTIIDAHASTIALPALLPAPRLQLPSHRRYQRGGVRLAATVADAQEFVRLRDYRAGDPVKHVHWRAWARYGRPIVREFQDEFFDRQALVVDTFVADRPPPVLEAVLSVAASFAAQPRRPDGLLDLMLIGAESIHLTSGRGVADRRALLRALALNEARSNAEFGRLATLIRRELASLSGVLCLFGRWDEQRAALLDTLRQHGIRHHALLVVTAAEEHPAAGGDGTPRPLRVDHLAADLLALGALR
ncbi:MAG: DUF58 domain-containing protein [Gammaproteobacteria bacterium]|nr:DUF58 domain-containing protein [Gammaproteobacteria bacterium]